MTYQLDIMDELILDRLPKDVRPHVSAMQRYWLPDAAASLYRQASAVLSIECHSPIIAISQGTPAIYLRQPTDTDKGQMYPDLGLGDWMLDIDAVTGSQLAQRLLALADQPERAMAFAAEARQRADDLQTVSLQHMLRADGIACRNTTEAGFM